MVSSVAQSEVLPSSLPELVEGITPALLFCGGAGARPRPPAPLGATVSLIGSKPNCHVRLRSNDISGCHALILNVDGRLYLRDLNSRTHVSCNGRQVRESYLRHGDTIRVGPFELEVSHPASRAAPPRRPHRPRPADLIVEGSRLPPISLHGPVFLVGRRRGADLRISDNRVSVAHAVLVNVGGDWVLTDLGSRGGTLLNGAPVSEARLSPGDHIEIGGTRVTFQAPEVSVGGHPQTLLPPPVAEPTPTAAVTPPGAGERPIASGSANVAAHRAADAAVAGRAGPSPEQLLWESTGTPDTPPRPSVPTPGAPPLVGNTVFIPLADGAAPDAARVYDGVAFGQIGENPEAIEDRASSAAAAGDSMDPPAAPVAPTPAPAPASRETERSAAALPAAGVVGVAAKDTPPDAPLSVVEASRPEHAAPPAIDRSEASNPGSADGQSLALIPATGPRTVAARSAQPPHPLDDTAVYDPGHLALREWGPLAVAVGNPQFIEAWGASRRGQNAAFGAPPDAHAALPSPQASSKGKWLVACGLLTLVCLAGVIGLGFWFGWWRAII